MSESWPPTEYDWKRGTDETELDENGEPIVRDMEEEGIPEGAQSSQFLWAGVLEGMSEEARNDFLNRVFHKKD